MLAGSALSVGDAPVRITRNWAISRTLVGKRVATWSMSYTFPDWSCTTSRRMFTAVSELLGAGPYLVAVKFDFGLCPTCTGSSQKWNAQYSAVFIGYFKDCSFTVPLRPSIKLNWVRFRICLVRQLFRVTTVKHVVGRDVDEPKIVLDGEGGQVPRNTRVQLENCGYEGSINIITDMRSIKAPSRLLTRPKGRQYCSSKEWRNSDLFRNIRPALGSTVDHALRSRLLKESLDSGFIEKIELSESWCNAGASEANRVPASGPERVVDGCSKHARGSCDDEFAGFCHGKIRDKPDVRSLHLLPPSSYCWVLTTGRSSRR